MFVERGPRATSCLSLIYNDVFDWGNVETNTASALNLKSATVVSGSSESSLIRFKITCYNVRLVFGPSDNGMVDTLLKC